MIEEIIDMTTIIINHIDVIREVGVEATVVGVIAQDQVVHLIHHLGVEAKDLKVIIKKI